MPTSLRKDQGKIVDLKPNQSPLSASNLGLLDGLGNCGAAFSPFRVAALQSLAAHGLPSATHELWRYTPVALLKPELASQARRTETQLIDGAHPTLKGVEVLKGAEAFEALQKAQKFVSDDAEAATLGNLCDATCSDITAVVIGAGVQMTTPVSLSALAGEQGCGSRMIAIIVGRGAHAIVVDDLGGQGKGLELERVELVLGAGCTGQFVHVQEYGDDVRYYGRHRITADRDAAFTTLHVALGARVSRLDIDLMLPASGAAITMLGVSIADGRRHVDFHPNQRHLAPYCRSDLFLKSVLKDKSRSVYYGYIKVSEGAQKTDAYQTNRNLVLSSDARADTIPNLEIKANDVKCSHGASVTNIGLEDRFYLEARGISPASAERLLVGGFLEDVLGRFTDEKLKTIVSERIAARLDTTR